MVVCRSVMLLVGMVRWLRMMMHQSIVVIGGTARTFDGKASSPTRRSVLLQLIPPRRRSPMMQRLLLLVLMIIIPRPVGKKDIPCTKLYICNT